MGGWVLVGALCAVTLSALAQLVLKIGADKLPWEEGVLGVTKAMIAHPWVISGVLIYGVSVAIWIWVLSRTDVSVAYPFAAVSLVVTAMLGWFVLGEDLSVQRVLGLTLIVTGCLILVRGA